MLKKHAQCLKHVEENPFTIPNVSTMINCYYIKRPLHKLSMHNGFLEPIDMILFSVRNNLSNDYEKNILNSFLRRKKKATCMIPQTYLKPSWLGSS